MYVRKNVAHGVNLSERERVSVLVCAADIAGAKKDHLKRLQGIDGMLHFPGSDNWFV